MERTSSPSTSNDGKTVPSPDARRRVIIAPSGKPIIVTRSYHRDPRSNGWSFEPEIVLARPIDVRDLLYQNDADEPESAGEESAK